MARFCGSCGAQLDDDAKVCGQCGTPLNGNSVKVVGLKKQNPEKSKMIKKRITLVFVLIIVLAIIAVGLNIASNYMGNKGLVRKVMRAYKEYDIDTLTDISSRVYNYNTESDYLEHYYEYVIGNALDEFEESVGHSYKFSYEIDEIYELSERKRGEILKRLENAYSDFDIDTIQKVAVAEIAVNVEQNKKSVKKKVKITMTKENKEWRVLYIE